MKKNYFQKQIIALIMLSLSISVIGQNKILCVGGGVTADENASDREYMDSLNAWGYTAEYIDDDTFKVIAPVWSNYAGLFINETVGSGGILPFGPSRDNYAVPCICLEGYAPNTDRWAWLAADTDFKENAAGTEDELTLVIKDNTHYITQVFAMNEEIKWSTNTADIASIKLRAIKEANIPYTAKLGKSLALAADDDFWAMVAIDTITLPNRVFWWGLNNWGMNGSEKTGHYMTAGLFKVLKRGCDWTYKNATSPLVSVKNIVNKPGFSVYPNPASNHINIRFDANSAMSGVVTIYSIAGQTVSATPVRIAATNNQFTINTSNLESGLYFMSLQVGNNSLYTKINIK